MQPWANRWNLVKIIIQFAIHKIQVHLFIMSNLSVLFTMVLLIVKPFSINNTTEGIVQFNYTKRINSISLRSWWNALWHANPLIKNWIIDETWCNEWYDIWYSLVSVKRNTMVICLPTVLIIVTFSLFYCGSNRTNLRTMTGKSSKMLYAL